MMQLLETQCKGISVAIVVRRIRGIKTHPKGGCIIATGPHEDVYWHSYETFEKFMTKLEYISEDI